jgi:hypothetical protein
MYCIGLGPHGIQIFIHAVQFSQYENNLSNCNYCSICFVKVASQLPCSVCEQKGPQTRVEKRKFSCSTWRKGFRFFEENVLGSAVDDYWNCFINAERCPTFKFICTKWNQKTISVGKFCENENLLENPFIIC